MVGRGYFRGVETLGFIRIPLLLALIGALVMFGFFRNGRSVWHPFVLKLTGGRSTSSVVDALRPKMEKRFPGLAELTDGKPIALLGFKEERSLEVWKRRAKGWEKVEAYPFTAFSGKIGPKLRQGDRQIPEGIYEIEYLNPNSSYYLSVKIDYPNAFDRAKAKAGGRTNLGGDIFIHGKNVTIGCIPVGDVAIEEIFYLVAKNGIANTQVVISPYDMRRGEKKVEIASVDWEKELYDLVRAALKPFSF